MGILKKYLLEISQALPIPLVWYQCVQIWMSAGKARPKADRHRAPNREMNSSRLGMATAKRTNER